MSKILLLIISIGIPVTSLLYAIQKKKIVIFVVGIAAFTISQLVIRIPLLEWISVNSSSYHLIRVTKPILFLTLLAITAGIFEEVARWIAMKYTFQERTIANGIIFGLGHGGMEAFVLVGIPALSFQVNVATNLDFYHSSLERFCAIFVHVCLSLIVLKAVKSSSFHYVIVAILLHGALNFGVVLTASMASPLLTMLVLVILTIIILVIVYLLYRGNKNEKIIS